MAKEIKKLPTIDIKGKKYVEVKTRILELHNQSDSFSLTTEILSDDDKKVVMQTRLKIDNRIFTGMARENKNQASPYENCETSSVGRCIGFYGIGIIESIESSDGMTKYNNNKEGGQKEYQSKPATEKQIYKIGKMCDEVGANHDEYITDDMTMTDASDRIEKLDNILQDLASNGGEIQQPKDNDNEDLPF